LCGYSPLSSEQRAGMQIGQGEYVLSKTIHSAANRSRFGVRTAASPA
jgi:hypothetical protein